MPVYACVSMGLSVVNEISISIYTYNTIFIFVCLFMHVLVGMALEIKRPGKI